MKKIPFISQCFLEFSKECGAKIIFDEEYFCAGKIIYKNGKIAFFVDTVFDLNHSGGSRIAKDKTYTKNFLKKFGYNVPTGEVFFSDEINFKFEKKKTIDDGFLYAKKLGFPVIVKPNNLSQGKLVGKVFNKNQYYSIAKKIFRETNSMIVEKFCDGNDYRVVVLDEEIYLCYERRNLKIFGNGEKDIFTLINDKNEELIMKGSNSRININKTSILEKLKRNGYDLKSILEKGKELVLLDNANLSTGGDLVECIDKIHQDYKNLAINVAKEMGLRYCGIDILTQDISRPLSEYNILEINSSPGFNNYLLGGEKKLELAKKLCYKIFLAMGE